ncbi:antibiotic biosynthesis monooxygenase [Streptomyces sp. NPDC048196]|uniref:putative quinol monooxygenase n=1 Tax=Streptomyces sp. NPDC048196 TaxID=3154712 RepID=UPI003403FCD5
MSLTVIAECLAAPGQEDRLRTALEAMIEPSLEEPGCLAYQPYADPNRPARRRPARCPRSIRLTTDFGAGRLVLMGCPRNRHQYVRQPGPLAHRLA